MLRINVFVALTVLSLSVSLNTAHAGGAVFKVDDIVESIKSEIMGAQAMEDGRLEIRIKSFDLYLSLVGISTSKGDLEFKVPGIDAAGEIDSSISRTHNLSVSMALSEKIESIPSATNLGILPAILNVTSTLGNALSTSPGLRTTSLSFQIGFVVAATDKQPYYFRILEANAQEFQNYVAQSIVIHMSIRE